MEKMLSKLRPQSTKSLGQECSERTAKAEGSTNVKVWKQEKHVEPGIKTVQYGWSMGYWERLRERNGCESKEGPGHNALLMPW